MFGDGDVDLCPYVFPGILKFKKFKGGIHLMLRNDSASVYLLEARSLSPQHQMYVAYVQRPAALGAPPLLVEFE